MLDGTQRVNAAMAKALVIACEPQVDCLWNDAERRVHRQLHAELVAKIQARRLAEEVAGQEPPVDGTLGLYLNRVKTRHYLLAAMVLAAATALLYRIL